MINISRFLLCNINFSLIIAGGTEALFLIEQILYEVAMDLACDTSGRYS